MFSYRVKKPYCVPQLYSERSKVKQMLTNVDLEGFRKSIGLHIRYFTNLTSNQDAMLRYTIQNIRIQAGVSVDQHDTSYETDNSFLSANSSLDENDEDHLTSLARKTLALNLMKIFRKDVPSLSEDYRNSHILNILNILNIQSIRCKEFYVNG